LLSRPKKDKNDKACNMKKWKEKDKKKLMDRVKDKYMTIKKMRYNMIRVDPMIAEKKRYEKQVKKYEKLQQKKLKNKEKEILDKLIAAKERETSMP